MAGAELVIGEVANPEKEFPVNPSDVEPIKFTLVAYDVKTKKPLRFEFTARGTPPQGALMLLNAAAGATGMADQQAGAKFIMRILNTDEDRTLLADILDREDIHLKAEVLRDLMQGLWPLYAGRPTRRRSASRVGPSPTKRTSGGGASAKASTRSRRATPSRKH